MKKSILLGILFLGVHCADAKMTKSEEYRAHALKNLLRRRSRASQTKPLTAAQERKMQQMITLIEEIEAKRPQQEGEKVESPLVKAAKQSMKEAKFFTVPAATISTPGETAPSQSVPSKTEQQQKKETEQMLEFLEEPKQGTVVKPGSATLPLGKIDQPQFTQPAALIEGLSMSNEEQRVNVVVFIEKLQKSNFVRVSWWKAGLIIQDSFLKQLIKICKDNSISVYDRFVMNVLVTRINAIVADRKWSGEDTAEKIMERTVIRLQELEPRHVQQPEKGPETVAAKKEVTIQENAKSYIENLSGKNLVVDQDENIARIGDNTLNQLLAIYQTDQEKFNMAAIEELLRKKISTFELTQFGTTPQEVLRQTLERLRQIREQQQNIVPVKPVVEPRQEEKSAVQLTGIQQIEQYIKRLQESSFSEDEKMIDDAWLNNLIDACNQHGISVLDTEVFEVLRNRITSLGTEQRWTNVSDIVDNVMQRIEYLRSERLKQQQPRKEEPKKEEVPTTNLIEPYMATLTVNHFIVKEDKQGNFIKDAWLKDLVALCKKSNIDVVSNEVVGPLETKIRNLVADDIADVTVNNVMTQLAHLQ